MYKLCIDAGHGGDPGAVGPTGLKEKDVALAVSLKLAAYLSDVADVVMTRTSDIALGPDVSRDLEARCAIANSAKADLFVSIHCNAAASKYAQGTEVHAFQGSGNGAKLAALIHAELVCTVGRVDRGIKYSGFYVLEHTTMPAVLVELAFISNSDEEKLLADPAFQDKCALAIAAGIEKYLGISDMPDQSSDTIKIKVGGQVLDGTIIDNRAYAPVRAMAEALGKKVIWDEETRTVTVS